MLRPGLALLVTAACGAQVQAPHHPAVDSVSVACVDTSEGTPHFVGCDQGDLSGDGAYVAIWFNGGTDAWLVDTDIALNDIELAAKEEVTIADEVIPVFLLADAFPEVRHGKRLPPAHYHLRVAVVSYRGAQQMLDKEIVLQ